MTKAIPITTTWLNKMEQLEMCKHIINHTTRYGNERIIEAHRLLNTLQGRVLK